MPSPGAELYLLYLIHDPQAMIFTLDDGMVGSS